MPFSLSKVSPWHTLGCRPQYVNRLQCPVSVTGPAEDFNYRDLVSSTTSEVIRTRWPELMDIVHDGSLVVVQRTATSPPGEPELVILVGTAHVSRVSAVQVERVINSVRPDNVVVELCKSRVGMMYLDSPSLQTSKAANLFMLTGTERNEALARSLRLGGQAAFVLRFFLAKLSEQLSSSAPVSVGAEFRAARRAAKQVGAQLVLGDRPIEITLSRAWASLSWTERFLLAKLFWQTVSYPKAKLDVSEEALQVMKSDDVLSTMYSQLGNKFPSLLRYLVWERDLYLAWSLKRSKAVTGSGAVVGVVGKGHLRGVVYSLLHNQEHLTFRDLVGQQTHARELFSGIIMEGLFGLALWLCLSGIRSL